MTVDDKFVLQDGASLPNQYELTDHSGSTPLSEKTEQDNAAYAAIQKQRRDLDVVRSRSEVTQAFYAKQGEILSAWIKNGAIGDPPITLSWRECEAKADELIDAAKTGDQPSNDESLDPSVVEKINVAAGIEQTKPKAQQSIDPQYKLETGDEDPNYTLIDTDQIITTGQRVSQSAAGEAAKKAFNAIKHPKETIAGIKHQRQVEKILKADSIDYEEILTQLRSDLIVAKDVVMTAVRRMASDIEQHGSHNLCELIATSSRLHTTLPNETEMCIRDALLDLVIHGHTDYAIDFLNELRLSNRDECISAVEDLSNNNTNNPGVIAEISRLRNLLLSTVEPIHDVAREPADLTDEDALPVTAKDDAKSVVQPADQESGQDKKDNPEFAAPTETLLKSDAEVAMDSKAIRSEINHTVGELLDHQTAVVASDESKPPTQDAEPNKRDKEKELQEVLAAAETALNASSIDELGQTLDRLRTEYPNKKIEIDGIAAQAIPVRIREIAIMPDTGLDQVTSILNRLYNEGLISAKSRLDLMLDYSESHSAKNSPNSWEEVAETTVDTAEEDQGIQDILMGSTPLTDEEVSALKRYKNAVEKNTPHKATENARMIAQRVVAPILSDEFQDDANIGELQYVYADIRKMILAGFVSQPDVLRTLERDLYGIVISDSNITAKVRKRIALLKTLINNFSKGNETFTNTLDEADKNKINRQVLLHGIVTSDNEDNLEIFVDKYTKSLSKDRELSGEEERELEAVIRTKKELLRNKALNEVVKLCKDPKQDFSEKLFDLLKDRRDMSDLAKVICERLLEEKSYEAVAMFISTLREKQLFGDYDVFMLVNTLVSASVIEEIEARNITNVHDGFRNDLIRALYANGELSVEVSDSVRITTESLRYTEDEEVISRFIEACKEIGISF